MRTFDTVGLALSNLRRTKFRTFLTVMGVVIGITSILLLVSLGIGLEKITTSQIANIDTLLTISVTQKKETASMEAGNRINDKSIPQIESIKGVKSVSPMINSPVTLTTASTATEAMVVALKKDFMEGEIGNIIAGREISGSNEAIISKTLAESITSNIGSLIGQKAKVSLLNIQEGNEALQVDTPPVEVQLAGIDGTQSGNYVYIPIELIHKEDLVSDYSSLKVKVKSRNDIDRVSGEIKKLGYEVTTVKELIDQVGKIFLIIQIVLAFFGAIGLLVATLGIINTMTISLIERIKEIGIMKAIGASNRDVCRLFVYESALIGLIGGIIGISIAYGIGSLFNVGIRFLMTRAGQEPLSIFVFSYMFSGIMLVFSMVVSVTAGVYPALRAQKLTPLKALYQR